MPSTTVPYARLTDELLAEADSLEAQGNLLSAREARKLARRIYDSMVEYGEVEQ